MVPRPASYMDRPTGNPAMDMSAKMMAGFSSKLARQITSYYQSRLRDPIPGSMLQAYRDNYRNAAAAAGFGYDIGGPELAGAEAEFITSLQEQARAQIASQAGAFASQNLSQSWSEQALRRDEQRTVEAAKQQSLWAQRQFNLTNAQMGYSPNGAYNPSAFGGGRALPRDLQQLSSATWTGYGYAGLYPGWGMNATANPNYNASIQPGYDRRYAHQLGLVSPGMNSWTTM